MIFLLYSVSIQPLYSHLTIQIHWETQEYHELASPGTGGLHTTSEPYFDPVAGPVLDDA